MREGVPGSEDGLGRQVGWGCSALLLETLLKTTKSMEETQGTKVKGTFKLYIVFIMVHSTLPSPPHQFCPLEGFYIFCDIVRNVIKTAWCTETKRRKSISILTTGKLREKCLYLLNVLLSPNDMHVKQV